MLMPALFDGSFDRPESLVVNDQDAIFMSPPLVARKKNLFGASVRCRPKPSSIIAQTA